MAIATLFQARAAGSNLVLLPVTLAARFQNAALLRQSANVFGPGDLRGRRVGVRAYSQTTALWLRGILHEEHGLQPDQASWITFEDAHVASYQDPPWAERAPAGSDMLAMLHAGSLDAAIFGNDTPNGPDLATVFPDPDEAGRMFLRRHGFMPVNHMVVVRAEVAQRPGVVRSLLDRFRAGGGALPFGRAALDPAVRLALQYATAQGLLERPLTLDEIWAGLPAGCED